MALKMNKPRLAHFEYEQMCARSPLTSPPRLPSLDSYKAAAHPELTRVSCVRPVAACR